MSTKGTRIRKMIKGLYVHIPFCAHNCFYCDFAKALYNEQLADKYLDELEKELHTVKQRKLTGLYIGGGTPTALNEKQLERLLAYLSRFQSEEYTVEINPETLSEEKAFLLRKYGVNRVSIGIQSFDEKLLKEMGRAHTLADINNTFDYLKEAGIDNISIDLIYGFNGQSVQDVLKDVEKALSYPIKHLSIYELEVHEDTFFGHEHYEGSDEDTRYETYQAVKECLKQHGFIHYEVSNFALEGYQSKHNQIYWHFEDYYGAGLAAAGKIGNLYYENTRRFDRYLQGDWRREETLMSDSEASFERIMMSLRLSQGVILEPQELDKYQQAIETNCRKGLLVQEGERIYTTETGRDLLNDILVDFLEYV